MRNLLSVSLCCFEGLSRSEKESDVVNAYFMRGSTMISHEEASHQIRKHRRMGRDADPSFSDTLKIERQYV
jgi:hypothetical protein